MPVGLLDAPVLVARRCGRRAGRALCCPCRSGRRGSARSRVGSASERSITVGTIERERHAGAARRGRGRATRRRRSRRSAARASASGRPARGASEPWKVWPTTTTSIAPFASGRSSRAAARRRRRRRASRPAVAAAFAPRLLRRRSRPSCGSSLKFGAFAGWPARRHDDLVAALAEQRSSAFAAEPATPLPFSTSDRRLRRRRRRRLRPCRRARRRSPSVGASTSGVEKSRTASCDVRSDGRQLGVAGRAPRSSPGRSGPAAGRRRRARSREHRLAGRASLAAADADLDVASSTASTMPGSLHGREGARGSAP